MTGSQCDECKPRHFDLNEDNLKGCLSCFCNGLSVECKSSDLYYRKELADFKNEDWYISNKYTETKEKVNIIDNGIQFNINNKFENEDLFFIVSSKFNGNHVIKNLFFLYFIII